MTDRRAIDVERVDFVSIPVRDPERARRFYGETLGLAASSHSPDELGTANVLAPGEPERDGDPYAANTAGIALRVGDVGEPRRQVEEAGVEFFGETVDTGVCHTAFCRDPGGNALILHRRYAPFG